MKKILLIVSLFIGLMVTAVCAYSQGPASSPAIEPCRTPIVPFKDLDAPIAPPKILPVD